MTTKIKQPRKSVRKMLGDLAKDSILEDSDAGGAADATAEDSSQNTAEYLVAQGYNLDQLEFKRLEMLKKLEQWERNESKAKEAGLPNAISCAIGARVRTFVNADMLAWLAALFMPTGATSSALALAGGVRLDQRSPDPEKMAEQLAAQGSTVVPVAWTPMGNGSKLTLFFVSEWPETSPTLEIAIDGRTVALRPSDLTPVKNARLLHLILPLKIRPLESCVLEQEGDKLSVEVTTREKKE